MRISDWSSDVCSSDLDMADAMKELQKEWLEFSYRAGIITHAQKGEIAVVLAESYTSVSATQATDMSGIATLQPTFILSKASLKELEGVKPELVATVKRAIEITIQDRSEEHMSEL